MHLRRMMQAGRLRSQPCAIPSLRRSDEKAIASTLVDTLEAVTGKLDQFTPDLAAVDVAHEVVVEAALFFNAGAELGAAAGGEGVAHAVD
jgi:hypothetical protein